MRASEQESTGARGLSEAKAKFEAIGWGPVENASHDLGTDLFIQVRDARRFDLGLMVGAQIKSGASYFGRPELDADEEPSGWWFREEDGDHFDYWIGHVLPHLLVLHNLETNTSHWAHVTATTVTSTGQGNKIFVPAEQMVVPDQIDALIDIAASTRSRIAVEGTAWTASASNLAPGQRYRYALLTPRLVAPHPNQGFDSPITPPEAVALIVRGRLANLKTFADKHVSVPSPEEDLSKAKDWGWRFMGAMWHWGVAGKPEQLKACVSDAPDPARRTVAAVAIVSSCLLDEQHETGIALLDEFVDKDDAVPIDWAWLLVHRGRLRWEIGDLEGARADALAASKAIVGDTNDITASVIASAAVGLLWSTLPWGERKVNELIVASDTVASWWRAQTISSALADATDESFLAWADDQSVRFAAEDTLYNGLLSASLGANLGAEHQNWRAATSLLARHELMRGSATNDIAAVADGIDQLRLCGDSSGLEKAAGRVWWVGPLSALFSATTRISERSWTQTSAYSNLKLWKAAGDLLAEETASRAADFCLQSLRDEPPQLLLRARPTFRVDHAAAEALAGVMPAASDTTHSKVANFLTALPKDLNEFLATTLVRVVERLRLSSLGKKELADLRVFATGVGHRDFGATLLGHLSRDAQDEDASAVLLQRASDGELHALSQLRDVHALKAESVRKILSLHESRVIELIEQARKNTWGMGVFDPIDGLARTNVIFPSIANWDLLLEALSESQVMIDQKLHACRFLAEVADQLSDDIVKRLAGTMSAIRSTRERGFRTPGGEDSFGGTLDHLAIALGLFEGDELARQLASLAMRGARERRDLARALGGSRLAQLIPGAIAALAGDESADVREAAGRTAARRLANGWGGAIELEIVMHLATSDGILGPHAILDGLTRGPAPLDPETQALVENLTGHVSARVRGWAATVLEKRVDPAT